MSANYNNSNSALNYSIGANLSMYKNEVTSLGNGGIPIFGATSKTEVGGPMSRFFGYKYLKIFQNQDEIESHTGPNGDLIQPNAVPGDFKFADLNNDGTLNDNDKTFIGNPHPDLIYGLNFSANYTGFSLSLLFQGKLGNDIYNGLKGMSTAGRQNAIADAYTEAWTEEGDTDASYPRITLQDNNNNFRISDWYVEDGSFIRLQNIQLGYTIPESLIQKSRLLSSCRLYLRGQNVFTLTTYSGLEPDIGTDNPIETKVYGDQTSSTFYKNTDQIKEALTGAYLQLRMIYNEYGLYHYFLGDISTDDAWKGGASISDNIDLYNIQIFNIDPTNGVVSSYWNLCYKLISRANEIIFHAPDATGDEELLSRYVKEAKFLRAFGYYNLVTKFGDVPLVLEPLEPSETTSIPRSSSDEVFQQIIADFTDAASLPAKSQYGEDSKYRATSGLAYTMLGKTYMFQKKFIEAEEALRNVVESGEYELMDDFGANWRIKNSKESVFEINSQLINPETPEIATGSNLPHYFASRQTAGYQGYGFDAPTQDLFDAFDDNDPRITYTFIMNGDRFLNDNADYDNSEAPSPYAQRKVFVPQYQRDGYTYMLNYNIRLIKYADVLLLYAEALNENGKSQMALSYLNQVRRRARNTPPQGPQRSNQAYIPEPNNNTFAEVTTVDQSELREIIWHERRVELAMEGWRRDDLLRQERFGEIMRAFAQKYNAPKDENFANDRDYLFPIPQSEIDNSNGRITQNPGF